MEWNCVKYVFPFIVPYSLETDSSGNGIQDCISMWKVREPACFNSLEVHGLVAKNIKLIGTCTQEDRPTLANNLASLLPT